MKQISRHTSSYLAQSKNDASFNYSPVNPVSQHENGPPLQNTKLLPTPGQPKSRVPRKGLSATLLRWWPELLAALFAIFAFVSIVAVAAHFRGHSIHSVGLPSGLTLNGLIALLSTISRAALLTPIASALSQEVWLWLFEARMRPMRRTELRDLAISDEASRGAWGSLLLLRHIRRSWIAHAAAVVTIVSLLFGTFTQQLITIKTFSVSETEQDGGSSLKPGNVPWSNFWGNYSGRALNGPISPPLAIKAAASSGIMSSNASPLTAECPTGNCTWPITPSLAICGGCVDSTFERSYDSETASYVYKMPSGYTANITNFSWSTIGTGFQIFPSRGFHYPANDNNTLYLSNWEAVGAPAYATPFSHWQNTTTVASECALWMCVQSFDTRQTNANQSQTVTRSFSQIDPRNGSARLGEDFQDYFRDFNISFLDLPPEMNSPLSRTFSVSGFAYVALNQYFATLFNGSVFFDREEQIYTSDNVQGIWDASADLDTWIQTVANSITNVIRTLGEAERAIEYDGTGYQLGYEVRWAWIVLPAILVGMSLLILVFIMVKTARSAVQAWKGSPLALLFMNVDGGLREAAMVQMGLDHDVEKAAIGNSPVVLSREMNGGWEFQQT